MFYGLIIHQNSYSSKIDFATFVHGIVTLGVVNPGAGTSVYVDVPEQKNNNYTVIVSGIGGGAGYGQTNYTVLDRTTTRFRIEGWTNGSSPTASLKVSYLLLPN